MLIRSQDKETIVNFNNVESLEIIGFLEDGKQVFWGDDENTNLFRIGYSGLSKELLWLGEYGSKQRAIEVLNEIQEAYERCTHVDCNKYGDVRIAWTENRVYQMPER